MGLITTVKPCDIDTSLWRSSRAGPAIAEVLGHAPRTSRYKPVRDSRYEDYQTLFKTILCYCVHYGVWLPFTVRDLSRCYAWTKPTSHFHLSPQAFFHPQKPILHRPFHSQRSRLTNILKKLAQQKFLIRSLSRHKFEVTAKLATILAEICTEEMP